MSRFVKRWWGGGCIRYQPPAHTSNGVCAHHARASEAIFNGLYFQSYESGPDTVQGIDSGSPLWAKANASADARLTPILFDYLQSWHAYGALMGPQNYFTFGAGELQDPYGIYTVLWDMASPSSAKLTAIDMARAQAPTVSAAIPSLSAPAGLAINASYFVGHPIPVSPNGFNGWPTRVYYLVYAPAALRVTATLSTGSDDVSSTTTTIALGGPVQDMREVDCPSSGNWATYVNCTTTAPFDVPAGVSVFLVIKQRPWLGSLYLSVVD